MTAQFNVMMNTMQQAMSSFRAELRRDQEETVEKAAKKARLATEVTFRRKGKEKKYHFNELVQDKLVLTSLHIEEASANAAALNPTVTTTFRFRLHTGQTAQLIRPGAEPKNLK